MSSWNKISSEQAPGKKVLGFFYNVVEDKLLITFDDETFVYLEASLTYGDVELVEDPFDPLNFGKERLLASGVITGEELTELRAIANTEYREHLETREQREYERLKVKYGDLQ
jgi:hypothetical protein